MQAEPKDFLVKLLSQCGPSGAERDSRQVWAKRTEKFADEIHVDVHGNARAGLNPKAQFKIMIAGHIDEIGFLVSHIDKDGFIYLVPVGGIDPGVLPGSAVKILSEKGQIDGVIGKKPIHLLEENERGKSMQIKELWVDIGAKDRDDALKVIELGDPVSYAPNVKFLRNGMFTSKGCDDKVGAFVASEVIRILAGKKLNKQIGVWSVATVQEEVGLRGARTAAYCVDPQAAIAVDVGFASDTPGIDKKVVGEVALGKGPVLHKGPHTNDVLGRMLVDAAKKEKIPYQFSSIGRPDGTDTGAIQVARAGVATALVSIPNRYMHTMVETCSLEDLENSAELIAATILAMKPGMSFIPR
jgi:tetrahedral aminopeptidase